MLSWDCVPRPPEIIGPWFLWKLLIDERHQRHGYAREGVRLIADLVHTAGADELLTQRRPVWRRWAEAVLRKARLRANGRD